MERYSRQDVDGKAVYVTSSRNGAWGAYPHAIEEDPWVIPTRIERRYDPTWDPWLPEPQITATHALGLAHGHEWASILGRNPSFPKDGLSAWNLAGKIEITCKGRGYTPSWQDPEAITGIRFPDLVPYWRGGAMHIHRTATGRLRWAVMPSGTAYIAVYRPEGLALAARVGSSSRLIYVAYTDVPVYARHVGALRYALGALGALDGEPDLTEAVPVLGETSTR